MGLVENIDKINESNTACDCALCHVPADDYVLSAEELTGLLDDAEVNADLAIFWEDVAIKNDEAASILDKALAFISELPEHHVYAGPFIADFARSLVVPENIIFEEDVTA